MKNLFLSLLAVATLVLFSCNKDELGTNSLLSTEEEAIVLNDAAVEKVGESADYEVDLFSGSQEAISEFGGNLKTDSKGPFHARYRFGKAPNVTIETTDGEFPKTITLDYGESTELMNGTVISGSITIILTAPPRKDDAQRTVTFNDFYVDSINIAGTRVITFDAEEKSVNCVADLVFTFNDGTSIERDAERKRQFIEGFDTPKAHEDDVVHITGFANSVSSEGYTFSHTIQEPLMRNGECRYIVEGIVTMSHNNEAFSELDFGDGTCDDIAEITKEGETRQITLGKRRRIRQQNN